MRKQGGHEKRNRTGTEWAKSHNRYVTYSSLLIEESGSADDIVAERNVGAKQRHLFYDGVVLIEQLSRLFHFAIDDASERNQSDDEN
jgi:hypothetical protein